MSYIWVLMRDCYAPNIDVKYLTEDNEINHLLNEVLSYYRTSTPDKYGNYSKIDVPIKLKETYIERIKLIIDNNDEGIIKMENCMGNSSSCCKFTLLRILKDRLIEHENNMYSIKLKPEEHKAIFW